MRTGARTGAGRPGRRPETARRGARGCWILLAFGFATGTGPGELAAQELWSGLEQGTWSVYRASSPEPLSAAAVFPAGSDLGAPAWSPDGSRIAVEAAGQGIAVCDTDGGGCQRLADVPGIPARPAWSPTGQLVFALYRVDAEGEDSDLWIVGEDLREAAPLVVQTGNQDDPAVSPDGRFLAYSSSQTVMLRNAAPRVVQRLWVMDLVTGEPRPLLDGAFRDLHPAWSPDGGDIAFASDRGGRFDIWVLDPAGGEPRQVTAGEGAKTWPVWSPDGRTLLFTHLRHGAYSLQKVAASATLDATFTPLRPATSAQMRDADWR